MALKPVATIQILTPSLRYLITLPNVNHEEAANVIDTAVGLAEVSNEKNYQKSTFRPCYFAFHLNGEYLEINEPAISVHHYVKQENFGFDTPDIRITRGW